MSEESATPNSHESGESDTSKPRPPRADVPVGDMSAEGETDIGPYPELAEFDNLEQADLPVAAEPVAEGEPHPAE